jgi:P-type DNA transfer protein VirB5
MRRFIAAIVLACALAAVSSPARAGIPVIDVTAIAQLIEQIGYWKKQIDHMVTQIEQLRDTHRSITGQRGMGLLLAISPEARNYLPEDWQQVLDAAGAAAGAYAGTGSAVQAILAAQAVVSAEDLDRMTPEQRALLEDARIAAAALQGLSRTAYGHTSQRFAQLQQLLAAIAATDDQKGILELQARIQSEQTMLQNEQNKLTTLYQMVQAQELARSQQIREHSVRGVGSIKDLPPKSY